MLDEIIKNKMKIDDKNLKLRQEELQFENMGDEILEMPIERENLLRQGKIGDHKKDQY